MATSNTTTFNLSFDSIIERAYESCGKSMRTGYDLKQLERSLNCCFLSGVIEVFILWKVKNHTQNLVAGTTTYTAPSDASDVLELVFRKFIGTTTDTTMTKYQDQNMKHYQTNFHKDNQVNIMYKEIYLMLK